MNTIAIPSAIIGANTIKTMSSVELVAIINDVREEGKAELRHDHFMAKIENHPGIDGPKFRGIYLDSMNRSKPCYHLPKRECELMVMAESLAVQAKVYDRMTELEAAAPAAIAAPASKPSALAPSKEFRALFGIGRLIGLDKNAAAIAANQGVMKLTGTNVLALVGQTHIEAENQEALYFTPTDLGKRIKVTGQKFNTMLADAGMQIKTGDTWEATDAGKPFARILDTGKKHHDGVPVQQVKWAAKVLGAIQQGGAA